MLEYLKEKGTKHETSVPYSPQQNGVAKRKNRYFCEMANCLLIDLKMDQKYWGKAIMC